MATKDLRINRQIRSREVFLIDENGEQKGVMNTYDAFRLAEEAGLDLVEVSEGSQEEPDCHQAQGSQNAVKDCRQRHQYKEQGYFRVPWRRKQSKGLHQIQGKDNDTP